MNKEEFAKIVKGLKSVYTEPTFIPDQYAFDVWYALLKDLDYQTVSKGTQKYMMSSRYTPKPSDIREHCMEFMQEPELNEMEAWSLVSKALRNGYYGAEQEFEKLPPLVQRAVGQPSNLRQWATTDIDSIENVIQSNFQRTYRAVLNSNKDKQKLNSNLRQQLPEREFYKTDTQNSIEQKPDYSDCVPMPQEIKERLKRLE
jgi:hypothetical protein